MTPIPAPDLTGEEREIVWRFEAAPAAPESWEARVETAARAMWADEHPDTKWWELRDWVKDLCRRRARAALASAAPETDGLREPYPCYCLPGSARCDDPYRWCDRTQQLESYRQRVEELFSGGPDTTCRTTWRRSAGDTGPGATMPRIECVEVPMDDLRAALASHTPDGEE